MLMNSHIWMLSQEIAGKIVDVNNKPIENVQVTIVVEGSIVNSCYTNKNGHFSMEYITDNFDVEVYCLGYDQSKVSIVNAVGSIKMENIMLTKKPIVLDEVVVQGESVVNYGNKILVFPEKRDVENAQSLLDLLQRSNFPGLSVNLLSQSMSINGKTNITYRINGVNASLQEVSALNPKEISHIEYQRISMEMRDVESAGVVNVYLKKLTGTFLSTAATGAIVTGFLNGNLNLSTGYTNSNITFNYGVNWRDYDERIVNERESYLNPAKRMDLRKQVKKLLSAIYSRI